MLASDIINDVLTILGVMRPGSTPSAPDQTYALHMLNTLLENWNVQGLHVFTLANYQHALTASQQKYTMGTAGDFPTARPVRIESANIIRGGVYTPLKLLSAREWASLLSRSAADILPQLLYNDNSFDIGGCTSLSFLPIPNDNNCTADLFVWAQLGDGFAIGDTVSFPPGYLKAIEYNLAVDLADAFGRPITPTVAQIAAASKQELRAINAAVAAELEARPPMQPGPPGPAPAPPIPQQ
ncbi:MAG: hypothetical protein ABSD56_00585 [Bryobacteraceae bacterium]|jgi:hypothetical protein